MSTGQPRMDRHMDRRGVPDSVSSILGPVSGMFDSTVYPFSSTNMNCLLTGNETGLLGHWGFETGGLTHDSGTGHDGAIEATGASVNFVAPLVSLTGCP